MLKSLALASAAVLAASSAHAAQIGDIFYIAMENHNWTQPASVTGINQIKGNSAAPFINSLVTPGDPNATMVSYASNYVNVSLGLHPSEPNYVWQEAGVAGPLNDADPYNAMGVGTNVVSSPNLSGVLQAKGTSWKVYAEDADLATVGGNLTSTPAPSNQYAVPLKSFSGVSPTYTNAYNGSHQYNYAAKHVGQVFFTDTNGGDNLTPSNPEAKYYAPLQQLSTDLTDNTVARYNWITPDQYNDMHSGLSGGFTYKGVTYTGDEALIAQGDNFLSQIVPQIEASQAFKNNGEIVIWNDETEATTTTTAGFSSMEIIISPLAKGDAYTNDIAYTHSNDLATVQHLLGVQGAPLGGAAGAYTMSDLYKAGTVPEPATWAMLLLGFGGLGVAVRGVQRKLGAAVAG